VAAYISGDFTASGGKTYQDSVLQIERFDKFREVVGIGGVN
jgi:hypothetical protein